MVDKHKDIRWRVLARRFIKRSVSLHIRMNRLANCFSLGDRILRVFYAGARSGNVGGGLVKAARLKQYFPEYRFNFNVVYSMSNFSYLDVSDIKCLKDNKTPLIHNQNGVFYPAWFDGDWKSKNLEMAVSYRNSDHVFFQSEFCRRSALEFLGTPSGDSEILYNAVDLDHFRPLSLPKSKSFNVLVTGKFTASLFYRLSLSIEAINVCLKRGLDVHLTIAGYTDKSCFDQVCRLIERLGIAENCSIIGEYSQAKAPMILNRAHVYLMLKHNDPCPNTVIEALACGVPVIYADNGGVSELVGGQCGIGLNSGQVQFETITYPDLEEIVEAITYAMSNLAKYGELPRQRAVDMFSLETWIARHREVFSQMVAG